MNMGKYAEAEKDIQSALHLDPQNINILQTVRPLFPYSFSSVKLNDLLIFVLGVI